jgi:hypothetical protein
LRADRKEKQGDKYVHYTLLEERQHIIDTLGHECFKQSGDEDKYGDIDPPPYFLYLFSIFIDLHYFCPNGMTYEGIEAFCNVTKTDLSLYEVGLIRRMESWASQEIIEALRDESA